MDYNEILDFGDGPATSVDEKLAILKFSYSWAEEMERHDREMEETAAYPHPALRGEGATSNKREMSTYDIMEKIHQSEKDQRNTYLNQENKSKTKENPAKSGEEWHDLSMENDKLRGDTGNRHSNVPEKDMIQMASKPLKVVENEYEDKLTKIQEEISPEKPSEITAYGKNKIKDIIFNPLANGHYEFLENSVVQVFTKTFDLLGKKYVQKLPRIEEETFPETPNEPPTYTNNNIQDLIPNTQEEKQVNREINYDVAEQYAATEGQGKKQENLGDGPESHLKDVGREAESKKKKDRIHHPEDERLQLMERLRAQLSQRTVKRKRRRRKRNGDKSKCESTPSQDEASFKGESGFEEAHRGIDENIEKLTQSQDAQKETTHQNEVVEHNTIEIEVDVHSAVTMKLTANVADDNDDDDDDDDDGFMPRRLFFFSFSHFKSDERTSQ